MKISIVQSGGSSEEVPVIGNPYVMRHVLEEPSVTFELIDCSIPEAREIFTRLKGLPGVPLLDENTDTRAMLALLDPNFARRLDIE